MTTELWILAFGAAVAGLVQGISGFAFSMVAVSIWVWFIDPKLAALMGIFGGLTGQIISAIRVRRGWHLDILWPFVLGSAIGIPIGNQLLPMLDPNPFKLVLGSLLVVCCSAMLLTSKLPHRSARSTFPQRRAVHEYLISSPEISIHHGGKVADAVVGLIGGVMAPLSGFSGLAPALWCTLRGYTKDAHRAVIQNFNLIVLAATFAVAVYSGRVHKDMWPQMSVVAGTLIVPAIYGSKIYVGMSPATFRKTVLWLLVLAGVTMLMAAIRSMMASA